LFFNSRVKADFIRTKYQQMAYINRLKDETNGTFEDLHLVKNFDFKDCSNQFSCVLF
jgi:hypothetical protein